MNENTFVEFSDKEFTYIMEYMKYSGATTVQNAILNAISIAFDNADEP